MSCYAFVSLLADVDASTLNTRHVRAPSALLCLANSQLPLSLPVSLSLPLLLFYSTDDLIDVIEGNRKYVKCLYCYNKIDAVTMEEVEVLATQPNSVVISCHLNLNMDRLVSRMWDMLAMVRIYTRRRGEAPDLAEPSVLTAGRGGVNIKTLCHHLHKDLLKEFKYALCWGQSCKHAPQRVGKDHELMDEDVVQIFKKTAKEYGQEKKGKTLTKQGVLAEPKKEVDKKDKRGPSSNRHDGGPAKNTGKMGKSAGFA